MRLLDTGTYRLHEFYRDDEIPVYATLSHRWGDGEVLFQDIQNHTADTKEGYSKLVSACQLAASHGFKYIWIDTCCIDKTSSSELSESINSMYRWYQDSTVCYAYLADVECHGMSGHKAEVVLASEGRNALQTTFEGAIVNQFANSNWFTRGWTLQELIAPSIVHFYSREWNRIGTKSSLSSRVSKITRIPKEILEKGNLETASIAQKMSWASDRTTTKTEDMAYSLMGIFGINMPMLYGEGYKAFIRLQEEIIKVSDDHSIFAWGVDISAGVTFDLLALSPRCFKNSHDIIPSTADESFSEAIRVDNKGIHLAVAFWGDIYTGERLALLPCEVEGSPKTRIGIYLEPVLPGKECFERSLHRSVQRVPESIKSDESSLIQPHTLTQIRVRRDRRAFKREPPILKPVLHGHGRVVDFLLADGASLGERDKFGETMLTLAVREQRKAAVELLLAKGDDPNTLGWGDNSPLRLALGTGQWEVAELLVRAGADPNDNSQARRGRDAAPLQIALLASQGKLAELLVRKGADPNSCPDQRDSPLTLAFENDLWEVAELLITAGADVNVNHFGPYGKSRTPLGLAIASSQKTLVEHLLRQGADPNKAHCGVAPLGLSLKMKDWQLSKLLIENGANVAESDRLLGSTPLLAALQVDQEPLVEWLLQNGANPDNTIPVGKPPLFVAIERKNVAMVKLLMEYGANDRVEWFGKDACSFAQWLGHQDIVELLKQESDIPRIPGGSRHSRRNG